jgi:hypothetical protein
MTSPLDILRYDLIDENASTLQAPPLIRSALVYTVDGRDTSSLVARFHELCAQEIPPRADNRLRHVACLQAAADVLGLNYPVRLPDEAVLAAVAEVSGSDSMWETFLNLALGLSLRHGSRGTAQALAAERLRAPLGADLHNTVQLLHQQVSGEPDGMTAAELGHLGGLAALSMSGTARAATLLALVAVQGAAWSPARLVEQAKAWAECAGRVERDPLRWTIDPQTKGVRATLTVRATGSLSECAGWALEDLVYLWPEHIERLMKRELPLEMIHGAKTRKAVLDAVKKGGIEAAVDLQGATVPEDQLAALIQRQDAGLAWIRANYADLSQQPNGIRLITA